MLWLALLLALAQGPVSPPSIDVAAEFPADKIVVIYTRNVPAGADVQFSIDPEPAETRELKDGGLAVGCAPGTYTVTLDGLAIDWEKKSVKRFKDKKTFKRLGAGPQPDPDPDPKPDPKPTPVANKLVTFVIEDVANNTADRSKFFTDKDLMAFFDGTTSPMPRVMDKGNPAAAKVTTKATSYPWFVIKSEKAAVLDEGPMPKTTAECLARLVDVRSKFLIKHVQAQDDKGDDESASLVIDGQKRSLGLKPRTSKVGAKFPIFGAAVDSAGGQPRVIPRSEWREVDLRRFVPQIRDQNGVGACNAFAATAAFQFCRSQRGLPFVDLWEGELYGRINGGRDQGSMLEDALEQLQTNGLIPRPAGQAQYAWRSRPSDWKTQAAPFKAIDIFECPTFDHIASALLQGYALDFGVMVGDNFAAGSDGWVPDYPRGGVGGHAMCAVGLARKGDKWGLITQNSWSTGWGQQGYGIVPETYFRGNQIGGHFAVRTVVDPGADLLMKAKGGDGAVSAIGATLASPEIKFGWVQVCRNGRCRLEWRQIE